MRLALAENNRSYRDLARDKLGDEIWKKVLNGVDRGEIEAQQMKDIVLKLLPEKGWARHNARMKNPTRTADSEEMAQILEDWWAREPDAGLHTLSSTEAAEKLVTILKCDDVSLKPLAWNLEKIRENNINNKTDEVKNKDKDDDLPPRNQAEKRLGADVWNIVVHHKDYISEEKMEAIANELGVTVHLLHRQRMTRGKMSPNRAEMVRIFEDWWEVGDLIELTPEAAADKLWRVLKSNDDGLYPLANKIKTINDARTASSSNAPTSVPEGSIPKSYDRAKSKKLIKILN